MEKKKERLMKDLFEIMDFIFNAEEKEEVEKEEENLEEYDPLGDDNTEVKPVDYNEFRFMNHLFWHYPVIRFDDGDEAIMLNPADEELGERPRILCEDGYEYMLDEDEKDCGYTIIDF